MFDPDAIHDAVWAGDTAEPDATEGDVVHFFARMFMAWAEKEYGVTPVEIPRDA